VPAPGSATNSTSQPTDDPGNIIAVRFVAFFLVMFGLAVAAFAVAHARGFDQSWRNGLIGAAGIAAALTVVNLLTNKGSHRLPTSR
jgi:threonine/homoserine/homoserine lactone efflux protein